jgi:urocanate hydratase
MICEWLVCPLDNNSAVNGALRKTMFLAQHAELRMRGEKKLCGACTGAFASDFQTMGVPTVDYGNNIRQVALIRV